MSGPDHGAAGGARRAPVPLSAYPLCTQEGRVAFLREVFMRGYPALFEGVAHVWKLLEAPKPARCFGIGLAAGTGGQGKSALFKFLSRVVEEGLATISLIPPIDAFPSLEAWNEAVKQSYIDDERALSSVLEKFAGLLVSDPFAAGPVPEEGEILIGPWPGSAAPSRTELQ